MAHKHIGTYRFQRSENLHEYLNGVGVGFVLRKTLSVSKPVVNFAFIEDSEEWEIITTSFSRVNEMRFKFGQEFQDQTYDKRNCKTTAQMKGDTMIFTQVCEEGPPVVVTHEIKRPVRCQDGGVLNGMLVTMSSGQYKTLHHFMKDEVIAPDGGEVVPPVNVFTPFEVIATDEVIITDEVASYVEVAASVDVASDVEDDEPMEVD